MHAILLNELRIIITDTIQQGANCITRSTNIQRNDKDGVARAPLNRMSICDFSKQIERYGANT